MQSQSMQKAFHDIHAHKHCKSNISENEISSNLIKNNKNNFLNIRTNPIFVIKLFFSINILIPFSKNTYSF